MKRTWISLLLVAACTVSLHAASAATVNATDVQVYAREDFAQVIGVLSAGMIVSVDREKGDMCLVNFNGLRGWVRKSALAYFPNRFTNVEGDLVLCEKIFHENNADYLYFVLNGKFRRMNVETQSVEGTQNVGDVSDLYPSSDSRLFLIEGVFTNAAEIHTLKLIDFKNGKSWPIGCFDNDKVRISGASFSPENNRLAVNMLVDSKNYVSVYDTSNGRLLFYARDAQWTYWFGNTLVMNDNKNFWSVDLSERFTSYDAGYRESRKLFAVNPSWVSDGRVNARSVGNLLYIETSDMTQAFDVTSKQLRPTPYRGLDFDDSGVYNFYYSRDLPYLRNVRTGAAYGDFSGDPAKKDFIRFAGNRVIYSAVQDRIESLFLYDPAAQTTYKYKMIDEIGAIGENGIAAESLDENGLYLIAVEIPDNKKFYVQFFRGDE